jgi:tetratricopeptide (TPR) repeat protein
VLSRLRGWLGHDPRTDPDAIPVLPLALRRGELASAYLAADRVGDHRRAAVAASAAADRAVAAGEWRPADIWCHRALWHYEQADLSLHATRAARRIGEVRVAAGEPHAARRYFSEAISEARDLGAEREEGLAALGMGRAELEMGNVTTARRMAQIAVDLLERCGAPGSEVAAARALRGEEKRVRGERSEVDA